MTGKIGIDVSEWQGLIDWPMVKETICFAIIRAGYGKNHIDKYFHRNAQACTAHDIPFGVYWFSYATSPEEARQEAGYCCDAIKGYELRYPVCFDFEYDSVSNAEKKGIKLGPLVLAEIGRAFLTEIERRGYYAANYTNDDFLKRGFSALVNRFDTWMASWGTSKPPKTGGLPIGIWQYTSKGRITGINGNVDMNIAYKDYPTIIAPTQNAKKKENPTLKESVDAALDVLAGKYGVGQERIDKLTAGGYNASDVQYIVNTIITYKESGV